MSTNKLPFHKRNGQWDPVGTVITDPGTTTFTPDTGLYTVIGNVIQCWVPFTIAVAVTPGPVVLDVTLPIEPRDLFADDTKASGLLIVLP